MAVLTWLEQEDQAMSHLVSVGWSHKTNATYVHG